MQSDNQYGEIAAAITAAASRDRSALDRRLGPVGQGLGSADAALANIAAVVDWLDGGAGDGVVHRLVVCPLRQAHDDARRLQIEKLAAFEALIKALPPRALMRWMEKLKLPALGEGTWTRSTLVAMALNMGNETGRARLLRSEGWREAAVETVLARALRREDWDFAQGVWDLLGSLLPQIAALDDRVNGLPSPKLEAREIETPLGTRRGGFYPLIDHPLSDGGTAEDADAPLFAARYVRATAPRGTDAERDAARPLWLEIEVIPRRLVEMIHDITHREAVIQVDRLLSDERVRRAIEDALGRDYHAALATWLRAIANQWAADLSGVAFWETLVRQSPLHNALIAMGVRMASVIARTRGMGDATDRLGARAMASGLKAFLRDPVQAHGDVTGKSAAMAARLDAVEQAVREHVRELADEARRFAFYGIAMMDMAVSMPTWIGAYEVALGGGKDDAAAMREADTLVHETLGSGITRDLPKLIECTELWRLATMIYSHLCHLQENRHAQLVEDFAMIAARSFWLVVLPALLGTWTARQGPDDADPGGWAVRRVPFDLPTSLAVLDDLARGLQSSIVAGYGGGASYTLPMLRLNRGDVQHAEYALARAPIAGSDRAVIARVIEKPGYVLGLPTTGERAPHYLWEVLADRALRADDSKAGSTNYRQPVDPGDASTMWKIPAATNVEAETSP